MESALSVSTERHDDTSTCRVEPADDLDDVILYLLPHPGEGFEGAVYATEMPKNESRFLPASRSDAPEPREIARQERGGTELPPERGLPENTARLVVRFSDGAKTRIGLVGGRAENADLVFQNIVGISSFHLAFTFDDRDRLIVRDLGSAGGTKVTYNGEKAERRSKFDWLLRGPAIVEGEPPILNVTDYVQFKVIVPPRDITSLDYINRVKRFRVGTADPEGLLASSILSVPNTRLPTGQKSPLTTSSPILYQKKLGKGAYGVVKYVWNVTSGDEHVVKRPLQKFVKNRAVKEMWENEANIMRRISHKHIVAFRNATFSPIPQLEFEYVPKGSLNKHTNLSIFEITQVLEQLLWALEYLHNLTPSVGHRDIKPENILVVKRGFDGIEVKFADFGLSKAADTLRTFCGTMLWAAPEIQLKHADPKGAADNTYSVAVDIWSLGVVVASLECGELPEWKDSVTWIPTLLAHVTNHYKKQGSRLLWFLLDAMLVEDPEERSPADYCHDEAKKLLQLVTDARRQQSTPSTSVSDGSSNTAERLALGPRSAVASVSVKDRSTFRLDVRPDSQEGSDTTIIKTVEETDESLIANRNIAEATGSEEGLGLVGVPYLAGQPRHVRNTSFDSQQQDTNADQLLWNIGAADSACKDQETTAGGVDETQTKSLPDEQGGISFLVRYHVGAAVLDDAAEEAVETLRVEAEEPYQSGRKRARPGDSSQSSPLPQSFNFQLSGIAAHQQAANQLVSSSQGPLGPPDHKRSKKCVYE